MKKLNLLYGTADSLLIGFAVLWTLSKIYRWIWLYLGIKLLHNTITFIPKIKEILDESLKDGFFFGIMIIVILLIIRND